MGRVAEQREATTRDVRVDDPSGAARDTPAGGSGVKRFLSPTSRILELGAPDATVARWLRQSGYPRYLGLVEPHALDAVRAAAGQLSGRFHAMDSPTQGVRASTDLLILRAPYARMLWPTRDLRHLEYVAVERDASAAYLEGRLAANIARWRGHAEPRGVVVLGETTFDLLKIRTKRPVRPRVYFSPVWGVEGLARRLEEQGIRYAVLRWFESLPHLEPGEDLDVLVADEDVEEFRNVLHEEPGTLPVDVYSESGLNGSDYQGAAYYPPRLAAGILDGAQRHAPSGLLVPGLDDHLLSLAYHAGYHKGLASGLPSELLRSRQPEPEHDYEAELARLALASGSTLTATLEGVDAFLNSRGWRPPKDTLRRLSASNEWIRRYFFAEGESEREASQVAVFLVRERTLTRVGLDDVLGVLDHYGFEVVKTVDLHGEARSRCALNTRGGNWSRGPFAENGGEPVVAVVTLHHAPQVVSAALLKQYPSLSNAEIFFAKRAIRDLVTAHTLDERHFNPVHSSDNEAEAWEYVEAAMPDAVEEVRAEVERRRLAAGHVPFEVVRRLSRGRRASVDVVSTPDGLAVCKTYAESFVRYKDREVRALRELGGRIAAVPELLAEGSNWFTCPLYENVLPDVDSRPGRPLVPLRALREMVAVIRQIHELGFDLVDAKPQNFVLDPQQGLKIVDFEFLHAYPDGPRPALADSYNFVAPPSDVELVDVPVGNLSYQWRWGRFTGLSRERLLEGPVAAQVAERSLVRLRSATFAPGAPPRAALARVSRRARIARGRLSWRFTTWARARALTG
jgi:hypothetical protein